MSQMTLDHAIQSVTEQESGLSEEHVQVAQVRMEPGTIAAGDRHYRLADEGLGRLARQVGAPPAYLLQFEDDLRAAMLQHHLDRGDLSDSSAVMISRAGEFLTFTRPDLTRLSGDEVVRAVLDGTGAEPAQLSVHNLQFHDESFQLDLLNERTRGDATSGDVLVTGLRITHSIIAEHATWIESFVFRLVCQNGLTHRECVSRRAARTRRLPKDQVNAKELQRNQIQRMAASVWKALGEKLQAISDLRQERVEVQGVLARWLEHARLPGRSLLPLLVAAWQEDGSQPTVYGAMNALTSVATHNTDIAARTRRALAGLAGLLAFRRLHLCPRCFSLLGGPQITHDASSAASTRHAERAMPDPDTAHNWNPSEN